MCTFFPTAVGRRVAPISPLKDAPGGRVGRSWGVIWGFVGALGAPVAPRGRAKAMSHDFGAAGGTPEWRRRHRRSTCGLLGKVAFGTSGR